MKTLLFLGQKPVGEKCFAYLLQRYLKEEIQIIACTNINEDVWWQSNGIYRQCQVYGIPVYSNSQKNNEILYKAINEYQVDALISVQHNWILESELLKEVNYNAFNLHLAKLPEYKGYNSFNHAILNGDKRYGVTLHWMSECVDEGYTAYEDDFSIEATDTAYSLYKKAEDAGYELFVKFVSDLLLGTVPKGRTLQGGRFYNRKTINTLRKIETEHSIEELDRLARACYFPPFEPAYLNVNGHRVYLLPESSQI